MLRAVAIFFLLPTVAYAQEANGSDVQHVERIEQCMVRVLGNLPHVEILSWQLPSQPVKDHVWQAFLTYRQHRHDISFAFTWYKSTDGKFDITFSAAVPTGLSPPGVTPSKFPDWGTGAIEKKWKKQCGVSAWTVIA